MADFLGSKITIDGDCSHEIKRRLLLGRKVMTNLDSILKSIELFWAGREAKAALVGARRVGSWRRPRRDPHPAFGASAICGRHVGVVIDPTGTQPS